MEQSRRDVLLTLATPEAWRKLTRGLLGSCGSLPEVLRHRPASPDEAGRALGNGRSARLSQLLNTTTPPARAGDRSEPPTKAEAASGAPSRETTEGDGLWNSDEESS